MTAKVRATDLLIETFMVRQLAHSRQIADTDRQRVRNVGLPVWIGAKPGYCGLHCPAAPPRAAL